MGAASVVAAVGFCGAGFMLWFLIALLREGAPSVCYWVVPVRRKEREALHMLRVRLDGGDCGTACTGSNYRVDLLENENHEKGKDGSSLITLDVRTISGRLGWRAIQSQRSYVLREHRLQ
ncbi:MAG: hypothetical protein WCF74_11715 [Candidatus Sulfotelmatobacter sp.]